MPINNDVYGVWKLLQWTDTGLLGTDPHYYVIEDAKLGSQQQIQNQPFVQGSALPLILNVGGATATFQITAPLIVTETQRTAERSSDTVSDGYRLWYDLMVGGAGGATANSLLKSNYTAETGVVFEQLSFRVDGRSGCRYAINLKGDSNYFTAESGLTTGTGITIANGTTVTSDGVYEMPPGSDGYWGPFRMSSGKIYPMRVGTFYDVVGSVSAGAVALSGYMERLDITYRFNTSGFNYVGQATQRQIMGISGIEAKFTGTMISSTRAPIGYEFPWQAMNRGDDTPPFSDPGVQKVPLNSETWGGTVKKTTFSFSVRLRTGLSNSVALGLDLVPALTIDQSLFESSTQQVSADLLRTEFSGFGWVTNPVPFS